MNVAIYAAGPVVGEPEGVTENWCIWKADNLAFADVIFEVHADWRNFKTNYAEDLRALDVPVYLPKVAADVPKSREYPLDAIVDEFGRYLESSIAYMLALAIHERRKTVYLFGVTAADEYASQRPNLEFLMGYAKAVGVRVIPQAGSKLMSSNWIDGLYGLEPI